MSLRQVINNGLIGQTASLSPKAVITVVLVSFVLGLFVYYVYKRQTKVEFYSKDFNITLPAVTIITASIIIAIQSNILVSLGMVGALSIVRFRTAVKSPMDLVYMFWALGLGIICAVKLYTLAVLLCFIMVLVVILLGRMSAPKAYALVIVKSDINTDGYAIENAVSSVASYSKISSVVIRNSEREVIFEVQAKSAEELVSSVRAVNGVTFVNYLMHHAERRF